MVIGYLPETLVLCAYCQEELKRSTVREGICTSTAMFAVPWYDEEGRGHVHDMNRKSCSYTCSRGHSFEIKTLGSCWCGWRQDEW